VNFKLVIATAIAMATPIVQTNGRYRIITHRAEGIPYES
jgi:hypothetical protein